MNQTFTCLVQSVIALFFVCVLTCQAMPMKPADDMCNDCEFFVKYIEGYLKDNKTVQQIIDALEQVCDLAPDSQRTKCDNFIEKEVPALVQYILTNEDPQTACTQLGFCGGNKSVVFSALKKKNMMQNKFLANKK